jgi:predicted RNA binding protein YcfA (HicA-like mRNA interferase family)
MPTLPVLSGQDVIRIFRSFGWEVVRQSSSHVIVTKAGENVTLSVPDHKEVAKGTLRSLIRSANITVVEFITAAKK